MSYRDRRLARADRLREWADKRARRSAQAFDSARRIADGIPFGQPILVGHHSEKHHRRDVERIDNGMRKGVEHEAKAREMDSRAAEIERQADNAIYSDDSDAIERLTEKIAVLEAQRERIKVVNGLIRKQGLAAVGDQLTEAERTELLTLMRITPFHHVETKGFPSYQLTNLGGNISRLRKRLELLAPKPPVAADDESFARLAQPYPEASTATERAGLIITETMTTPAKAWKKPRQVWNVTGNAAMWSPLLQRLGGTLYRGMYSFWEDPTEDIEAGCLEAEAHEQQKAASSGT